LAKKQGVKPVAQNRRARHDYFVEETVECGMELKGTEVKSMRAGKVNLKESYARVRDGEVLVEGMHVSPYEQGSIFNTDPLRPKRLLLHKSEIRKLQGLVSRQGYTLIPLSIYLRDGRMKLELGVCRGKQLHDKRDDLAERDANLDIQRALRRGNREGRGAAEE
jgi:SsrA-binding protein